MSPRNLILTGLLLVSACSSVTAGTVYTKTHGGGLVLPDFTTTDSVMTILDSTVATSLTLRIDLLTHPNVEDLRLTLIAPDLTTILVFGPQGGSGDNIINMWLDERSTYGLVNSNAPFTGVFMPQNSMAGFLNKSILGNWTLSVYDNGGLDEGRLYSWSLMVNEPIPEPSTMAMLLISAGGLVLVRFRRA